MTLHIRRLGLCAAMTTGLLALAPVALAQHQHGHEQGTAEAAVSNMQFDNGQKWPTDEPLRAGMAAIHAAFKADHPAIHAGTETDAQYEALAGTIETQVNAIIASCKLPPEADANLHYAVADLLAGVALMRGTDPERTRHDGAALVHGALQAYGRHFDDPQWGR